MRTNPEHLATLLYRPVYSWHWGTTLLQANVATLSAAIRRLPFVEVAKRARLEGRLRFLQAKGEA